MGPKPKQKLIIAFDLYGTLLDTSSISTDLLNALTPEISLSQEQADQITAKWRQYQLEYTWRLTSMSSTEVSYIPFDKITRASLIHACEEARVKLADSKADELMASYDNLQCFAEVLPALKTLRAKTEEGHVEAFIFSNGTEKMLSNSVATSPTLKLFHPEGDKPLFSKLISVNPVKKYKPQKDVYEHLQREAAGTSDYKAQAAVWLVSANEFDVVGARAAGVRAAWVDRKGTGWVDRLGDALSEKASLTPTIVVKGVDEAIDKILAVGI
ncbi:hypothetical protein N0V93_001458 [Gnomoniopsis smithogilvyi]|uniref:Haloacid dehalogenase n=1 Tax=Gnomoniopsis smithogilvyi TaxID=1191159 RepID=A0A9W9D284_9PEZI|nr:hypothetical protein N0V93_001458 [Gnomoniopsis smithogilvyi]